MDEARYEALMAIGCLACKVEGCIQPLRTEAHHLVDNGYRRLSGGDDATIPLCGWHHRGEPSPGLTGRLMRNLYGPSLATDKKAFVAKYGKERYLLGLTDDLIKPRDSNAATT